jgi:hypothetical protein
MKRRTSFMAINCRCVEESPVDPRAGERLNYLTMALEARRALNALRLCLKSRQRTPELTSSLSAATASLEALGAPSDMYAKHGEAIYSTYEEIKTLQEVRRALNVDDLNLSLKSLLSDDPPKEDTLRMAIRFFTALESRALHHCDDPALSQGSMS